MAHHHRFFTNPREPLNTVDARQELLACLDRINTYSAPVHTCSTGWSFHGLYTGPTSIAYLFHRLSEIYPDLEFKQQPLSEWAQEYLNLGSRISKASPKPTHCGIADEVLAHLSVSAVMQRDLSLIKKLCTFEPVVNSPQDDGSNEWLYGRAGYLYMLRLCRTVTQEDPASPTAALLESVIDKTVARILAAPRPWTWHGKHYLGAAHGAIGIICQVVLSRPAAAPELEDSLLEVLDAQRESGSLPSSLPSGSDRLVQFCHGSPGLALSLRSVAPHFPALRDRIAHAAARARADVWARGVLRKDPCLCHGVAGNALAFGGGDDDDGEGDDQDGDDHRFAVLLSCAATESMEKLGMLKTRGRSDEFSSLFTGEAGRAWLWAVADRGLPRTCIGYNDV